MMLRETWGNPAGCGCANDPSFAARPPIEGFRAPTLQRSQQSAVVLFLQSTNPFLDGLQLNGQFIRCLDAFRLGGFVTQVFDGWLQFHRLNGDVFAGFANLFDSRGSIHGGIVLAAGEGATDR